MIVALKQIDIDDEITMSYIDTSGTVDDRAERLLQRGLPEHCPCVQCRQERATVEFSESSV